MNPIDVLLIEDNPADARLIREMLIGDAFVLVTAEELREGIEYLQVHDYDVVLLDLSLPDSMGLDTVLTIRKAQPDIALVVLTGFDDQSLGIQAVQSGAQDYLVKGDVDTKLLKRAIHYAIERQHIEETLRHSQEEYRSLIDDVFDTSMVGVIILDSRYKVVWCNEAAEIYFGIDRKEIIGQDKRQLIDSKLKCIFADPDDYAARLLDAYENATFTDRFECHVLPDLHRQERWLEHWSQPIHSGIFAGGRIEQYTDITDRKLLEFAELEQRRFAEALRDIAVTLTSTLDLGEVLDRILENIDHLIPHDIASITLKGDSGEWLEQRQRVSNPDMEDVLSTNLFQLEKTPLFQHLMTSNDPFVIPDMEEDESLVEIAIQNNIRSYAGVPIRLQDETIGFINVFAQVPDAFQDTSLEHLTAFAEQCAIAIQNAQLYLQSLDLAALEERQRLARDLHDSVSQTLFTCRALAESALRKWDKDLPRAHELLSEVHLLTATALSEMRILLLELRPNALTQVSLKELFEQYLQPIQKRRGFELRMEIEDIGTLPPDVQISVYRIVQEALNNIDKHAGANLVKITVTGNPDGFMLVIQDNGKGFSVADVRSTSLGMNIMHERAETIAADFNITSQQNVGTQITLSWRRDTHTHHHQS